MGLKITVIAFFPSPPTGEVGETCDESPSSISPCPPSLVPYSSMYIYVFPKGDVMTLTDD